MSGILISSFGGGANELVINLSNKASPNISSLLSAASWDGYSPVRFVVDPGALVNTLVIPAISFPTVPLLYVGSGATIGGVAGNAAAGGNAFTTLTNVAIENYGSFKGGGGAGGNGGNATVRRFGSSSLAFGGVGGRGQGFSTASSLSVVAATLGDYGYIETNTTTAPPGEWITGDSGSAKAISGSGGSGGAWRTGGSSGQNGSYTGSYSSASAEAGKSGYAAGANIVGLAYITWIVRGDA